MWRDFVHIMVQFFVWNLTKFPQNLIKFFRDGNFSFLFLWPARRHLSNISVETSTDPVEWGKISLALIFNEFLNPRGDFFPLKLSKYFPFISFRQACASIKHMHAVVGAFLRFCKHCVIENVLRIFLFVFFFSFLYCKKVSKSFSWKIFCCWVLCRQKLLFLWEKIWDDARNSWKKKFMAVKVVSC